MGSLVDVNANGMLPHRTDEVKQRDGDKPE